MTTSISYPWYAHAILYRSLELKFTLRAEEPLRIGVGRAPPLAAIDLPVVTINVNGVDQPYIPGSSFKGVLRSTSELIAKSSGLRICMAGSCSQDQTVDGRMRLSEALEGALRDNDIPKALELVSKHFCLACKIFGSGSYASHIQVSDSYPKGDVRRGVKMGIAINRRSGAVQTGPYAIEFVEPGAQFTTTLRVSNLPNYSIGLLLVALDYLDEGLVKVGGFKSRGFGRVTIDYQSLTAYILQEGRLTKLGGEATLEALDEWDKPVRVRPQDVGGTLEEFKTRWWEYVQSTSGRKSQGS